MNKRIKRLLTDISTEDLLEELAQRNAVDNSQAGKDWYYMLNREDDEENNRGSHYEHRTVWIVHKRFWHMNHHMDDRHVEGYLTLPNGITECQESMFDFSCSYEEAERQLQAYGYTPLPTTETPGRACWSALINQCMTIAGHSYRCSMHADTPEIKAAIEAEMNRTGNTFASEEEYKGSMRDLAISMGCVVEWYDAYSSGCYGCMMRKEVWESLPLPPHLVQGVLMEYEDE